MIVLVGVWLTSEAPPFSTNTTRSELDSPEGVDICLLCLCEVAVAVIEVGGQVGGETLS